MRLSEFILTNLEEILTEWESFARTIIPDRTADKLALRDHAEEILKTISLEMETHQTESEQFEKSQGRGSREEQDSAAESHSAHRFELGFDHAQVVSEYRALRATVIRLWMSSSLEMDHSSTGQLIRFNEGIDQAICESVARFTQNIEKSRDFATAVLVHDLRNPLNAILMSVPYLQMQMAEGRTNGDISRIFSSVIASGIQMKNMINNLFDFTRLRFGQTLPIKTELTDLAIVCRHTVAELMAAYPRTTIHCNCTGDLQGVFDATRIGEMLSNLIANAAQHGSETAPIMVEARLESEEIVLQVHNEGPSIPPTVLSTIFNPWTTSSGQAIKKDRHLGLGLYITREIVAAHSGKISVTSTAENGTTFFVYLPRTL